ncbi:unnamed protein product [Hyaloperonospora brassicae]|uniref:ZNF598/HEL2 PAH domain-containing protein n=1 Tax=Hyaloperonospora brassicae TaxID=162125 RepID=A0AAV0V4Z2_HYABA|nr:unnamed protein product [Hyaloperonospora brassicae]
MTTSEKNSGHRRVKQMQGLLLLARLDGAPARREPLVRPQRMTVLLQPQRQQLVYSARADQDMLQPLGRVNLRGAKLEQLADGFIIHEARGGLGKTLKLQDNDKATIDAWFFAVYSAITEHKRPSVCYSSGDNAGHRFSAVLTSSMRDEHTDVMEFELSCQLVLPLHERNEKSSIKWTVWKTLSELQAFDDELRVSFGAHMTQIAVPRDRRRDSLFGGMRKKSLRELKEQQLALYVEQVFQMLEISTEPMLVEKVRQFLGLDAFFETVTPSLSEKDTELTDAPASADSRAILFADTDSARRVSDVSMLLGELEEDVTPLASYVAQAPSRRYSCTEFAVPPVSLTSESSTGLEQGDGEIVEVIPEADSRAAKKLHKKIIQTVRELVANDGERVQEFQDQTKDFGRERMSAKEYCAFLVGAVGAQECCKLVLEMARLLPDEAKRNELMQARAVIWRRTHRRHRRRSKQISESVVMKKSKEEQQSVETALSKMRPKSDCLSTASWDAERVQSLRIASGKGTSERLAPEISSELNIQPSKSVQPDPAHRVRLADPRRHLNRRASFNTIFGETLETNPIEEENPADNESDDDSYDGLLDQQPCAVTDEATPIERKLSMSKPVILRRRHSSFLDKDDEDESTGDDDESDITSRACRSRKSRHCQQSGDGSGGLERRDLKERSTSRGGLTRTRSRQSSFFVDKRVDDRSAEEEDDSHSRFRRNQRHASRKFDEEAKCGPVVEEENPVLARLKKQGAVNFMMQLR